MRVDDRIVIDESELEERFTRAGGPGGQNVNKVATAVQLRFDVARSPSLPDEVRERLQRLARGRISRDGVLVIEARSERTQHQNRQDARERLRVLIQRAATRPKSRKRTRPSRAARQRRVADKKARSVKKRLRRPPSDEE